MHIAQAPSFPDNPYIACHQGYWIPVFEGSLLAIQRTLPSCLANQEGPWDPECHGPWSNCTYDGECCGTLMSCIHGQCRSPADLKYETMYVEASIPGDCDSPPTSLSNLADAMEEALRKAEVEGVDVTVDLRECYEAPADAVAKAENKKFKTAQDASEDSWQVLFWLRGVLQEITEELRWTIDNQNFIDQLETAVGHPVWIHRVAVQREGKESPSKDEKKCGIIDEDCDAQSPCCYDKYFCSGSGKCTDECLAEGEACSLSQDCCQTFGDDSLYCSSGKVCTKSPEVCPLGMVYSDCGSCPITCEMIMSEAEGWACDAACREECVCNATAPYLFVDADGNEQCVNEYFCRIQGKEPSSGKPDDGGSSDTNIGGDNNTDPDKEGEGSADSPAASDTDSVSSDGSGAASDGTDSPAASDTDSSPAVSDDSTSDDSSAASDGTDSSGASDDSSAASDSSSDSSPASSDDTDSSSQGGTNDSPAASDDTDSPSQGSSDGDSDSTPSSGDNANDDTNTSGDDNTNGDGSNTNNDDTNTNGDDSNTTNVSGDDSNTTNGDTNAGDDSNAGGGDDPEGGDGGQAVDDCSGTDPPAAGTGVVRSVSGNKVEYTCDTGYTMTNPSTGNKVEMTCQGSTWTWSGGASAPPTCEPENTCGGIGATCTEVGDCCSNTCTDGICAEKPPPLKDLTAKITVAGDCTVRPEEEGLGTAMAESSGVPIAQVLTDIGDCAPKTAGKKFKTLEAGDWDVTFTILGLPEDDAAELETKLETPDSTVVTTLKQKIGSDISVQSVTSTPAGCGEPTVPTNAEILTGSDTWPVPSGFQVSFKCKNSTFELKGTNPIECKEDTTWTTAPTCEPKQAQPKSISELMTETCAAVKECVKKNKEECALTPAAFAALADDDAKCDCMKEVDKCLGKTDNTSCENTELLCAKFDCGNKVKCKFSGSKQLLASLGLMLAALLFTFALL
eukprot:TRINITY_DN58436_c0_g1_i1.p1 TRINITY_DN58436_c0_g1~~TRINITY_DN58436_c0_g1_i1.p1  ORF type:complete len:982 (-),score=179.34 TRINITY_DN58436_c0_g1_i1:20-2896(-)